MFNSTNDIIYTRYVLFVMFKNELWQKMHIEYHTY